MRLSTTLWSSGKPVWIINWRCEGAGEGLRSGTRAGQFRTVSSSYVLCSWGDNVFTVFFQAAIIVHQVPVYAYGQPRGRENKRKKKCPRKRSYKSVVNPFTFLDRSYSPCAVLPSRLSRYTIVRVDDTAQPHTADERCNCQQQSDTSKHNDPSQSATQKCAKPRQRQS